MQWKLFTQCTPLYNTLAKVNKKQCHEQKTEKSTIEHNHAGQQHATWQDRKNDGLPADRSAMAAGFRLCCLAGKRRKLAGSHYNSRATSHRSHYTTHCARHCAVDAHDALFASSLCLRLLGTKGSGLELLSHKQTMGLGVRV